MAKGENIYRRKDGRWEGRYKKGYGKNQKIQYGYCYGHSYRETKEKLDVAKANLILNPFIIPESQSQEDFAFYCVRWLRINEARLKNSTFAKYQTMLSKHIVPELGHYHITEINSDIITIFTNKLLYEKQLAVKTVRDILCFVHQIICYIQTDMKNRVASIIISYPKTEHRELRVLSIDEQHYLTQYLLQDTDIYKFSVLLALFTGLRIGEICALQWKDISIESKSLRVHQTVQRIKNPDYSAKQKTILQMDSPKSLSSFRTIPITDGLASLSKQFMTNDPETFVMTGKKHFIDPRKLQRRLKKYTDELHLQDVHFHTLRHTFATRCIELGCDVKTLSEILGHSSISITMNRYVHPSLEHKRKNITKLEQAGFFPPSQKSSELHTITVIKD